MTPLQVKPLRTFMHVTVGSLQCPFVKRCHVPGTVLGAGDAAVNRTQTSTPTCTAALVLTLRSRP